MTRSALTAVTLVTLTTLLLASCNGAGLSPTPPTGPSPDPTPPVGPTAPFTPEPGAAVGSGDGTPGSTVRISPNTQEIEIIRLVNEVRTRGTLNGQDMIAGTCAQGSFTPGTLRPISYQGTLAHAARMHALYMNEAGYEGHDQLQPGAPTFYGARPIDRIRRSQSAFNETSTTAYGENVAYGQRDALEAVRWWMNSPGHCQNVMDARWTHLGTGHVPAHGPYNPETPRLDRHSWVQVFGR